MDDPTSVLSGLDEFVVVEVALSADDEAAVRVVIETAVREAGCPDCGVISTRIKERPLCRLKDLPASGQPVVLLWRKRRYACLEEACVRRSFVERTDAIPPRSRLTERLRLSARSASDSAFGGHERARRCAGTRGAWWR
jgi:transposase